VVPYLSNVTGTWIRAEEATDPGYWARQLRGTVRFADGVAELLAEPQRVLLEVGPGNTLSSLSRQHPDRTPAQAVVSSMRHPKQEGDDQAVLLESLGRLWIAGAEVDWSGVWAGERRRRVPLPTYPFERRRYWVEPRPDAGRGRLSGRSSALGSGWGSGRLADSAEWFSVPGWRRVPRAGEGLEPRPEAAGAPESWLLFADRADPADPADPAGALAGHLAERLAGLGHRVATVAAGECFEDLGGGRFRLAPGEPEGYERLLDALGSRPAGVPGRIVHLWNVGGGTAAGNGTGPDPDPGADLDASLDRSFYSLLFLARALGGRDLPEGAVLTVVSDGLQEVTGRETLDPVKATLLGPCGVIPREVPGLACRSVDLDPAELAGAADSVRALLAEAIVREARAEAGSAPVALRGRHRWVRAFEPVRLEPRDGPPRALRTEGVYLITGGLGGLGLEIAGHLAREVRARLVLVGRSPFPPREGWEEWLAGHGADDPVSVRILRLRELESAGARVLVLAGDVASPADMHRVRAEVMARFGALHGVVHAAGVPGGGLIRTRDRASAERVLAPKLRGALALHQALGDLPLDLFVLFSSVTAVAPVAGQADYAAANAFLDAFASWREAAAPAAPDGPGRRTVAIAWDAWRETGMAVDTEVPDELAAWRRETLERGLSNEEGVEAFRSALASGLHRVVVSTVDLDSRLEGEGPQADLSTLESLAAAPESAHPRPDLANAYVAPSSDAEEALARIWQETLGIDRVGVHDNFFDLGGNSLAGLRITRAIQERLGAGVSDISLYEAPTVATLARLVGGNGVEEAAAEVAPATAEALSRGERRKARLAQRRGR
jgi:NAD(P)-dependent dehydrogenase (short-subunit alcohol dehydrogenase family)/acyl carrier protein